jgi:tetratricopeptide (TPR) repeat protein
VNPKKLIEIMALRDAGNAEKALQIAQTIVVRDPSDAMAQYQLAWTLDALGRETEAVGHYEFALSAGLGEPERENAMLGLGSSLRALGRFDDAERVLGGGVLLYPSNAAFRVFRAMNDYNRGEHHAAIATLLRELARSSTDPSITMYHRAIEEYAEDLNRRW